jgi:hypothetical protein
LPQRPISKRVNVSQIDPQSKQTRENSRDDSIRFSAYDACFEEVQNNFPGTWELYFRNGV